MLRHRAKSPTGMIRASALQKKILGAELTRLLALHLAPYNSELHTIVPKTGTDRILKLFEYRTIFSAFFG